WEVQGNVKQGQRHIYAQRNFFVDEDSWMITLADHYDGRGTLWRVGEGHLSFNYKQRIPGYALETLYDLLAGRYIALGMYTEEASAPQFVTTPPTYNQFTPAALRAAGVRRQVADLPFGFKGHLRMPLFLSGRSWLPFRATMLSFCSEQQESPMVAEISTAQWIQDHPLIQELVALREVAWFNPAIAPATLALEDVGLTLEDVRGANDRLARFAPYIARVFPQTSDSVGIIESPVRAIPQMQQALGERYALDLPGHLWVKLDSHLPISGSIKARGGIHEVLQHAEKLALEAGWLSLEDDYSRLDSDEARAFFRRYRIAVGSTGNLGMSIGIMSATLGFQVTVHMSADARQWKKDRLRSHGVTVVEHASDYSVAVEEGRQEAEQDPDCHFIDDENSTSLFLGYAVAA